MLIISLYGCGGGGGGGGAVVSGTPTPVSPVIFSDSFSDGAGWSTRWTIMNDTADPANWNVSSGVLVQQNEVIGFNRVSGFDESYHEGTYALLVDPAVTGVSNYRFSVDIKPLQDPSGNSQGNDVGIIFGYQSDSRYYRVTMSARYGFTRFEKRTGRSFETLAVNARGYVDDQPMTMAAEINGNAIVVWINGEPIFAEVDPAIYAGTVALYGQDRAQFDNVLITENPVATTVAISTPLAYSVTPSIPSGKPVQLTVTAVVLNLPAGGSVAFSLDGGSEIPIAGSGNVYTRVFPKAEVDVGNHDIAAVVRDAGGTEVASDINSMVGTGGDYYVSAGDSITNGVGDKNPVNNDSADGRIVAIQGFQAVLNNRMTVKTGLPQIVFNEGIGGDKASELESKIPSILERHPGANKVLLMIGTNDSNAMVAPVDYRASVAAAAGTINGDGKLVWLAETLPTNVDVARNTLIQQYNSEIRGIANPGGDDIFLGPDFYAVFDGQPSLYEDELHPNDAGYVEMAQQWRNVLPTP